MKPNPYSAPPPLSEFERSGKLLLRTTAQITIPNRCVVCDSENVRSRYVVFLNRLAEANATKLTAES
jgi:hypothetical protein